MFPDLLPDWFEKYVSKRWLVIMLIIYVATLFIIDFLDPLPLNRDETVGLGIVFLALAFVATRLSLWRRK